MYCDKAKFFTFEMFKNVPIVLLFDYKYYSVYTDYMYLYTAYTIKYFIIVQKNIAL